MYLYIYQLKQLQVFNPTFIMSRNNTVKFPYCKVCHDAGKDVLTYRSHFTREMIDPNSRVLCPTLLALECRYCFKKGHTIKYCPTLKQKNMQKNMQKKAPILSKPTTQKPAAQTKSNNPYTCLDYDSQEETEKQSSKPIEAFPQLCVQSQTIPTANSYAAVLSKPLPKEVKKSEPVVNSTPKLAPWVSAPSLATVSIPVPPPPPMRRPMRNWADDTDSEDEEDIAPSAITKPVQDFKFVMPVVDEDW